MEPEKWLAKAVASAKDRSALSEVFRDGDLTWASDGYRVHAIRADGPAPVERSVTRSTVDDALSARPKAAALVSRPALAQAMKAAKAVRAPMAVLALTPEALTIEAKGPDATTRWRFANGETFYPPVKGNARYSRPVTVTYKPEYGGEIGLDPKFVLEALAGLAEEITLDLLHTQADIPVARFSSGKTVAVVTGMRNASRL